MKKLIYEIKSEGNKLKEKNNDELNEKIQQLKKEQKKKN